MFSLEWRSLELRSGRRCAWDSLRSRLNGAQSSDLCVSSRDPCSKRFFCPQLAGLVLRTLSTCTFHTRVPGLLWPSLLLLSYPQGAQRAPFQLWFSAASAADQRSFQMSLPCFFAASWRITDSFRWHKGENCTLHVSNWKGHQKPEDWVNPPVAQKKGLTFYPTRSIANHPSCQGPGRLYCRSDKYQIKWNSVRTGLLITSSAAKDCHKKTAWKTRPEGHRQIEDIRSDVKYGESRGEELICNPRWTTIFNVFPT